MRAVLPRLPSIRHFAALGMVAALTSPVWAQTPATPAAEDEIVSIDQLQVEGTRLLEMTGELRDMAGYDDVYERNVSTAYIGKEMVERFKGAAPADVLKGLLNVHSGDSRNSGALDPNIRGIQGPGRVPVTIDGTEQALTVWRGYNGANNRNYIDPNLIGGIQVFKGPSLERDVPASVGGAVVIKTLDADDILREGQNFGMEVRVEGSNNATTPRIPVLMTGRHVDDVKKEIPNWSSFYDVTTYVRPRTSSDNNTFSIKDDYAYRIALAGRLGDVSLMGAYAYRNKDNHFAGKNDAGWYSSPPPEYKYEHIRRLALAYHPGNEVPNTSSELESWLFKATWKPSANQQLNLGYRTTLNNYGEIMPSRLNWQSARELGAPQWPISQVDMKAYNLSYRWIADNPWIDLHANLWRTDTTTDAYNSGGYLNSVTKNNPIISNSALMNTLNDRNGITLSNRVQLSNTLNLTVGGNFQYEKLGSKDLYDFDNHRLGEGQIFRRTGRREEYDLHFNVEWQLLKRLTLTGGARYSSYWSMDDLLAARVKTGKEATIYKETGRKIKYYTQEIYSEELIRKLFPNASEKQIQTYLNLFSLHIKNKVPYKLENTLIWHADANGRYHRADNPCTNGMLDGIPNQVVNIGCPNNRIHEQITLTSVEKRRDHNWTPAFSAIWKLTDHERIYLRHSQAIRYPSMFESTIGFSATLSGWELKPEHTYNNEIAYIYDKNKLFSANGHASIKLAYFHHRTKDVIERGKNLNFWNVEKQTIRGIELQGRFDNNYFFIDLGLTRNIENEVCDEHSAVLSDIEHGTISDCVRGGFMGGYLITMVIPEFSANGLIGGRFLNSKLETGIRVTHHKRHRNIDFTDYIKRASPSDRTEVIGRLGMYQNTPMEWGDITVFDAYANWQFSEHFSAELTGTNLGNIYYVDPITRSAFPAPGRTLKLAMTYQF